MDPSISSIFNPKSIAVVGASKTPGKIGYEILSNILGYGYGGKVYPVNPTANEILGLKCYPKVSSIPGGVDMVVISVPAKSVLDVVEDAGNAGAKVAVVISSGFKEVGNVALEEELVRKARSYGMRVLGPNIFGVVYTPARLNASFGPRNVIPGGIAFITQSGALGIALMGMTIVERIGVSSIISVGNKADVDDADLLQFLADDPSTKVVLIYLEGVNDGRRFIKVASEVITKKPVVVIKAGRTEVGAKAVASHTGSLAGNVVVYKVAFNQAGILAAHNVEEAFDISRTFANLPFPTNEKLVVVTNGGGAGVLVTDTLAEYGITLTNPPQSLVEQVRKLVPPFASLANPIDVTGMISNEGYVNSLLAALNNPEVGAVLGVYCQTAVTDPTMIAGMLISKVKEMGGLNKPLAIALIGGEETYMAIKRLNDFGIPTFPMPERAATSIASMYNYLRMRESVISRLKELS
ncbi:MAG: CoA-binding protein [Sulfolobales archaeon]|nr:CoA-binding protein [Sulfolobales archaeon]MCX8186781.1 CoA-binding protein [Sulfolobales archaeon]MDW7969886.1 CoA-binding protein [Sulfolobales archaeon]